MHTDTWPARLLTLLAPAAGVLPLVILTGAVLSIGMGSGAFSSDVYQRLATAMNVAILVVGTAFGTCVIAALVALFTPRQSPRQIARWALTIEIMALLAFWAAVKIIA